MITGRLKKELKIWVLIQRMSLLADSNYAASNNHNANSV